MKKYLLAIYAVACCLFLVAPMAMADIVNPTLGAGTTDDDDFFTGLYGSTITLISKQPDNEGVLPGELHVVPLDFTGYSSAGISWDLTGDGYVAKYVAVKDGSTVGPNGEHWLYYEVTENQGIIGGGQVTTQVFQNTAGNISHISLYGIEGGDTKVPEPATLLLLGSGLVGFIGLRRKIKHK